MIIMLIRPTNFLVFCVTRAGIHRVQGASCAVCYTSISPQFVCWANTSANQYGAC